MRFYTLILIAVTSTICFRTCDSFIGEPGVSRPTVAKSKTVVLEPIPAVLKEASGRSVTVTKSKISKRDEFKYAQFVNADFGWAASTESLYKTSNAGKTWERANLNLASSSQIASFFFLDDTHGWLVIRDQTHSERYGFGNSSRILVSSDGGRSWSEQSVFSNEVKISSIRFVNLNEGLAIGSKVVREKQPYDEMFALRTSDGGKQWNDISERVSLTFKNEYGIANDIGRSIHWPSLTQISLLTKFGRIISSTDGGNSWNNLVQFEDKRPNGSLSSTGYYKILLDTRGRMLVIGGASGEEGYWGDTIVSDDLGSWISQELIGLPIRDAIVLSDNELLACGWEIKNQQEQSPSNVPAVGIILESVDRGKSWSPVYRSEENEDFIYLTKNQDNSFYVVSNKGNFLRLTLGNK